jgi:hypothetical protein
MRGCLQAAYAIAPRRTALPHQGHAPCGAALPAARSRAGVHARRAARFIAAAHALEHLQPVEVWQAHVQNHQRRQRLHKLLQALLSGGTPQGRKSTGEQGMFQHIGNRRFTFNNQDAGLYGLRRQQQ